MLNYLLKRALSSLIALFLFVTFMFFVTEIMIPGDFTTQFSEFLSPEQQAEMQRELGVDRPLVERYLSWCQRLLHGNLGTSFYGSPVVDALKKVVPYTLLVFFLGTVIAFQLGQWLGCLVTWPPQSNNPIVTWIRKALAGGTTLGAVMFYTAFPPWLAFLVAYMLSRRLKLVRRVRRGLRFDNILSRSVWFKATITPQTVMLRMVLVFIIGWLLVQGLSKLASRKFHWRPPAWLQILIFTGLQVGSWYAFGFGKYAVDVMAVAAIPLITYTLLSFGETLLIMRTSIMDTVQEDYITTARAKGVPEPTVRDQHAARTALFPVLSRLIVSLPYMLTGVVIVEDVLDWPGISNTLFNALYQQDMPMVMGSLLLVGIISAAARLLLDVLYALLDPRIRYDRGQLRRAR